MLGSQVRCAQCEFILTVEFKEKQAAGTQDASKGGGVGEADGIGQKLSFVAEPTWSLRIPEGTEFGPVDRGTLDNWVRQGRVSADCRVRAEGDSEWKLALHLYSELDEGNPFVSKGNPNLVRHRGNLVLALALAGCLVPLFSVIPAIMGTRDLRRMSKGQMDSSGEVSTRAAQAISMVASIIWIGAAALGLLTLLVQLLAT